MCLAARLLRVTRTRPWTARSPMRCRLSSILSCQVRRENMLMLRVLWNCCAPSRGSSTMSYVKWHDHVPGYCRVRDEGTRGGGSIHDEFAEVLFQPSFIGTEACRFHNTSFLSLTKRDADICKHLYVTVMLSTPGSSSVLLHSFPPWRHWRCLI